MTIKRAPRCSKTGNPAFTFVVPMERAGGGTTLGSAYHVRYSDTPLSIIFTPGANCVCDLHTGRHAVAHPAVTPPEPTLLEALAAAVALKAGKRVFATQPLETVPWLLNVLAAEHNLGLAAKAGASVLFAVDGERGVSTLPDEPGWLTISRMLVTGH